MSAIKQVRHVLIVGGGITGLSAAYYLQQLSRKDGTELAITIVEKSERWGGKVQTMQKDGFVIEKGPDSFLARKQPIIDLSRELGIDKHWAAGNHLRKKNFIMLRGKLHPMPPGLVLGIPTKVLPFLRTGLISPWGKLRAAMDMLLPKRQSAADESLGHFLERRLGREVVEHLAEPLLAGIYAGDTRSLSLQATFPQFQLMERKYRSLIMGMMRSRKKDQEAANAKLPAIARDSLFLSYKGGLSTIIDALVAALTSVKLLAGSQVTTLRDRGGAADIKARYEAVLASGERLEADSVIIALPAFAASELVSHVPEAAKLLRDIRYVSVANVVLAYRKSDITHPLDGAGFVVPRKEGKHITACTWTSSKWLHTSPEDHVLLRCYVGRSGEEAIVHRSDQEIVEAARTDLREMMGLTAEPIFHEISRHMRSMPQYAVGHGEHVAQIRSSIEQVSPDIWLTGSAFHGVGLPDCIRQGKEAAERNYNRIMGKN